MRSCHPRCQKRLQNFQMKEDYISNRRILLHDYLSDRRILAYCGDSIVRTNIHTGVPKESIAGPLLLNNFYDGLHHIMVRGHGP